MAQSKLAKFIVIFSCVNLMINVEFVRSEKCTDSWVPRKLICFSAVVGVIVTSPYLLAALGFSATGITAGSVAAKLMSMGLFTKGGILAWVQSMSMKGTIPMATLEKLIRIITETCLCD